jgi:transcription antitermination factor NusG
LAKRPVPAISAKGESEVLTFHTQSTDVGIDETRAWWAVYTRHQHEKTVAEMLSAKGFEVFLPLYDSMRRWKDRKKLVTLPLFPCYVFVHGGQDRRLQILTTPGIHTILFCGEQVATIPEAEIQAVRMAVEGPSRIEPHPYLKCGERVRVIRGSLEGVEGILVRKKNLCRLILSVDMMAQSVAVEIDASDVEPVTQRAFADIFPSGCGKAESTSPRAGRADARLLAGAASPMTSGDSARY